MARRLELHHPPTRSARLDRARALKRDAIEHDLRRLARTGVKVDPAELAEQLEALPTEALLNDAPPQVQRDLLVDLGVKMVYDPRDGTVSVEADVCLRACRRGDLNPCPWPAGQYRCVRVSAGQRLFRFGCRDRQYPPVPPSSRGFRGHRDDKRQPCRRWDLACPVRQRAKLGETLALLGLPPTPTTDLSEWGVGLVATDTDDDPPIPVVEPIQGAIASIMVAVVMRCHQ